MGIEIRGIGKKFGEFVALEGIDLSVRSGGLERPSPSVRSMTDASSATRPISRSPR